MKVLIVGKGGREHAIATSLLQSDSVEQVFAVPGNQGMEPEVQCFLDLTIGFANLMKVCKQESIDLVIIGPEDPLVAGLADQLRAEKLLVFGPGQKGAQLEGSKIKAKEFMEKHGVPTAPYVKVESLAQVEAQLDSFTPPYVLKADGLAAGKGVFICETKEELLQAAHSLFNDKSLGVAGESAILEQFQPGRELSFFILTNGQDFVSLPLAQDHKRLQDGNKGPNTGGMGTVAPLNIPLQLYQDIVDQVVRPTVAGLNQEAYDYRGVVFIGIMVTEHGPQVLEYNVRFGDPETQVLLPLLKGDWGRTFRSIAMGELPHLQWKKNCAAACVVMAAENYPANPVKGVEMIGDMTSSEGQYFLHAGTKKVAEEKWVTSGGRVLNAIGLGSSIQEAIAAAYEQQEKVKWPGVQFRSDIGSESEKF